MMRNTKTTLKIEKDTGNRFFNIKVRLMAKLKKNITNDEAFNIVMDKYEKGCKGGS